MCGIAGIFRWDDSAASLAADDKKRVEAMVRALRHRGPDGNGVLDVGGGAILGHTRLSIIDLSDAASQPMRGERVSVTYNGELYNFKVLRERLLARGARLVSSGDTEALVRCLDLDWDEALPQIDGMFAFGAFDPRKRELLLARDRIGKKPLFFAREPGAILFASELGALGAAGIPLRLDESTLADFLVRGYVPAPKTLCANVEQLRAGEQLIVDGSGRIVRRPYWTHPWLRAQTPAIVRDVDEAAATIRDLFEQAVVRRLMSDVPLGAFLSGGVDSAAVVAMAQRHSPSQLHTFNIGFEGAPGWDESPAAKESASLLGTLHTAEVLKPDCFDVLPTLISRSGEPLGDSSLVPTFLVSRLARRDVTVVVTGDGGDELFAGYDMFPLSVAAAWIPSILGRTSGSLLKRVGEGPNSSRLLRRAKRWSRAVALGPAGTLAEWAGGTRVADAEALLGRRIDFAALATPERTVFEAARANGAPRLHAILAANLATYLQGDILVKVDRASMANSLEARSPLLDTKLLEYATSLAPTLLARGLSLKWIMKRALASLVPETIRRRQKRGFGAPVSIWFRTVARTMLQDRLLSPGAKLHSYLDKQAIAGALSLHVSGAEDCGIQLWRLWALEEWLSWLPTTERSREAVPTSQSAAQ